MSVVEWSKPIKYSLLHGRRHRTLRCFYLDIRFNHLIIAFAKNRNIHKYHFSLVVNTAFADLSLGVVSLLYSLTMSASNSGQFDWNGEDQQTSLYFLLIFDTFFSRRPRLFRNPHILWEISRHISAGEAPNIINTSIQKCYFYSVDTRPPYLCDQDCIKSPSFLQTHHVHLGAISVNHVWL